MTIIGKSRRKISRINEESEKVMKEAFNMLTLMIKWILTLIKSVCFVNNRFQATAKEKCGLNAITVSNGHMIPVQVVRNQNNTFVFRMF